MTDRNGNPGNHSWPRTVARGVAVSQCLQCGAVWTAETRDGACRGYPLGMPQTERGGYRDDAEDDS